MADLRRHATYRRINFHLGVVYTGRRELEEVFACDLSTAERHAAEEASRFLDAKQAAWVGLHKALADAEAKGKANRRMLRRIDRAMDRLEKRRLAAWRSARALKDRD